jgi:hypothetical protein
VSLILNVVFTSNSPSYENLKARSLPIFSRLLRQYAVRYIPLSVLDACNVLCLVNPKSHMRQNLTFLLMLCCLCSFAQFYVQQGTTLSFERSDALVSSQETLNQINTSISGKGTLLLNRSSDQLLTSTQAILKLPTLHLKNANLVLIDTPLALQHQLLIDTGQLTLFYNLRVSDPTAIVLGTEASMFLTSNAQVVYTTQVETSNSLVVATNLILLKYTRLKTVLEFSKTVPAVAIIFNFDTVVFNEYDVFFKQSVPPPQKTV